MSNKVDLEEKTAEIDEGQVASDLGKTLESRPQSERVLIEEDQAGPNPGQHHVALAGQNLEPMHDDFNLEDNFTFVDQFINDKPTEEDPGKTNIETEVESMVTVPIHQASSLVPPLSTHDLPKADMKEIIHQRMFKSGSYKTHPDHKALYEALKVSMDRENQEALHETLTTSRKRRQDE
ncbi:hypothetical protein Tco_0319493 [Tanacetum coccineum]